MVIFIVGIVSIPIEKTLESHNKVCENKELHNFIMSSKSNKILEFKKY